MSDSSIVFWQRLEGVAIVLGSAAVFIYLGFAWYWLFVVFLIFDVGAIGYIANPKVGALTYNFTHSLVLPFLLGTYAVVTHSNGLQFVVLIWLFHIGVDRMSGFGLKYPDSFAHTHLGTIGKKKK